MTALNRCRAALRIFGDDLIPEELSRLFNHFYTRGWVKGYQYSTSSGALVVKKTGAWILDAEPTESADFDGQRWPAWRSCSRRRPHWSSCSRCGPGCPAVAPRCPAPYAAAWD